MSGGGAPAEAFTFAWGDPASGLCGSVRSGRAAGGESALALLFSGADVAAAAADPGDVEHEEEAPERWRVRWDGDEGGWDLAFAALGGPLEMAGGGVEGREQPCRVTGSVRAGARRVEVDCLGQRGHQWGAPDWERIELSRTLSAWLADDCFVVLGALRPAGASGHADEQVEAWLVAPDEPVPLRVDEARVSTTYDGGGHHRRAGVELWPRPDASYPRRLGGELRCGTSLDLGERRLDAAFFSWHMEGLRGLGRYDVLRRA